MKRTEFPKRIKLDRFRHAEGRCEHIYADGSRCNKLLLTKDINFDHEIPVALGGASTFENCRVLCLAHHREKTGQHDVPRIAKAAKQEAKIRLGIRKPSRGFYRPPGTRFNWNRGRYERPQ